MSLMVTTNQILIIDTWKRKRKDYKHCTKESHQPQQKRIREETELQQQPKQLTKWQQAHPINNYLKYKGTKCSNEKTGRLNG